MSDYPELKWVFELSLKLVMKVGVFNNISEDSIHSLKKTKTLQTPLCIQLVVYNILIMGVFISK